jgi:[NiFe] hydrogenase assembly HybE family chaperone
MQALAQLEAVYRDIAATRMAGLPLVHATLRVQAKGFKAEGDVATGVLVTPWCMNLLRLPLRVEATTEMLAPGHRAARDLGEHTFEFTGAELPALGRFEQCSLFSPMFAFADQAAAVATAQEVLRLLRPSRPARVEVPARRRFLFGRGSAHG